MFSFSFFDIDRTINFQIIQLLLLSNKQTIENWGINNYENVTDETKWHTFNSIDYRK